MSKIIFGFVGEIASGKGTACEYLINNYQAGYYRFSTIIRDIIKRLYIAEDREHLQKMSSVLRENFGQDIFAKVMAEDVNNDKHTIICVDGIRRQDDIIYLKKIPGFILVNIFADLETRYQRIVKRSENQDDKAKTFEQFKKDHENENEALIEETGKQASEKIDNNGTEAELVEQIEKMVEKYK
ncbi:hypothetical protein A2223_00165 [Candidatus Falkowbacteria bacterium RIFOXYA2_FULL_35_8]|uniref:Dephospho-CoA kinase n=1 Tax=Candidatus Falkowbacteria bacterium RIFOXYC2_FULL_36_12 TaxID=1798002 RepID=A0A1F5SYL9_9BACT|nr:MAG: hypothetical protein A2300_01520 [Candidatus Falkowbacteria bacterium RIFOXYB2_FULL_35_7]OGF31817.1 MAG: hypothetical protein A2478_05025 [Candidatus Falkowbacteria bacterium RIFOXYC2_FULL_36_12]OGF33775.1 MAG: hypothetical protein A2223_00165 [Candidatus Falkowbacteria bacterium RIFOXYA2_FULL_35_8]